MGAVVSGREGPCASRHVPLQCALRLAGRQIWPVLTGAAHRRKFGRAEDRPSADVRGRRMRQNGRNDRARPRGDRAVRAVFASRPGVRRDGFCPRAQIFLQRSDFVPGALSDTGTDRLLWVEQVTRAFLKMKSSILPRSHEPPRFESVHDRPAYYDRMRLPFCWAMAPARKSSRKAAKSRGSFAHVG